MTTPQLLSVSLVAVMMAAFLWGRLRYDIVAMLALLAGVAIGIIPAGEAFKGFAKPKGAPDDLKLIAGITPELEAKLNKLGLIKFEQIANLSDDDIARVDEALALNGQIEHDDWTSKAVALMAETTADEVPAGEDEEADAEEAPAEAKAAKTAKAKDAKAAKKAKKG